MTSVRDDDQSRWNELSRIYHAALEREASAREAYLDTACAGDDALRREVASLLAHDRSAGLLDNPPFQGTTTRSPESSFEQLIGRQIDGYRVTCVIGAGGMGVVFKAVDSKFDRPVAIKFVSDALADTSARQRFMREAQTASSLNHPHILTVHDIGELDRRQYLVTEFVDGGTLRDWAKRARRSWHEVVDLLIGVADALATAHEAGIVHRDVKPQNILVSKSGYAKLADFGLAKLLATSQPTIAPDASSDPATRSGVVVGTLGYMSPEQIAGAVVDARSDQFSFGVVLHELLTGRRPFAAPTQVEELQRVISSAPDPLDTQLPEPLRMIVRRALETLPGRRYGTMRELLEDLRRVAKASGSEPAVEPVASRQGSRRVVWASAAAVVLIATAVLGVWRFGGPRLDSGASAAAPIHSIAVLPFQNLSGDPNQEYFSDGMTETLISTLAQIHALDVTSRTSVMRFKATKQSVPEIGRTLGVDAIVESSVQRAGDRVKIIAQLIRASTDTHLWSKEFSGDASDLLTLQSDIARAIAAEIQVQISPRENQQLTAIRRVSAEAQDAFLRARFEYWKMTADGYRKAIQLLQRAIELQPDYAAAYAALSLARRDLQSVGEPDAEGDIRKAAYKAVELDPNLAEAQAALGALSNEDWDWAAAEQAFRRAIELNPDSQDTCTCYSGFLSAMGRHSEALALMQHAVKVNPLSAAVHASLGDRLYEARRYPEAERALKRALELEPDNGFAHFILGLVYQQLGKKDEAIAEFDQPAFRDNSFVAYGYAFAGRLEEAEQRARRISTRATTLDFFGLSLTYAVLGQKDLAFQWLTKAFDARVQNVGWANVSPVFDVFRGDPRFDVLLARLHLPS